MDVHVAVDHTSSGKQHFEVLDGLRGSAAFLIVIFHVFNYPFGFRGPFALVHHAYLAVDFFFALSGFVVAYAYDDRWTRMSVLNTARMGKFSSDRAIREYCEKIWNAKAVKVELEEYV